MTDPQEELDFTGIETPRFQFKIKDENGEEQHHSLDMDGVMMDLKSQIPTALSMQQHPQTGEEAPGIKIIFDCLDNGIPLPEHMPPVKQVYLSVRKSLGLPDDAGFRLTMQVFFAFVEQFYTRVMRKKDTPVSRDSQEDTPESSTLNS